MDRRTVLVGLAALAVAPLDLAAKRRKGKGKGKGKGKKARLAAHDRILADVARRMIHGYRDEGQPYAALEDRLAAGERIEVLCGTQSALGVRALQRAGYTARVVGSLTHEPFTGSADGHVMLEVRLDGRWQGYDLTANAQAIDGKGRGLAISTLCQTSKRRWRTLCDDPLWSDEQIAAGNVPWIIDTAGWYDRVLGIPWVADAGGRAVFHDPAQEARIVASYPWVHPVDAETWRGLLA